MTYTRADKWDQPLLGKTPADLYWAVVQGLTDHPVFSMFTQKAIRGMAEAMIDSLPTKENDERG